MRFPTQGFLPYHRCLAERSRRLSLAPKGQIALGPPLAQWQVQSPCRIQSARKSGQPSEMKRDRSLRAKIVVPKVVMKVGVVKTLPK